MTDTLLDLLDHRAEPPISRDLPLEEQFELWRQRHGDVLLHIERLALAAHRRGAKRLSMKSLFEAVRAAGTFDGSGPEPWRLNNSFTPLVARWLVAKHPELDGLFVMRARRVR